MGHEKGHQGRPTPNFEDAHNQKAEINGRVEVAGVILTKLDPALQEKKDAAEEQRDLRDQRRLGIEKWTLLALVIYALIAAYQAFLVYEANQFSSSSLISIQRAFVIISSFRFTPVKIVGATEYSRLDMAGIIRNSGHTVALNGHYYINMAISTGGQMPEDFPSQHEGPDADEKTASFYAPDSSVYTDPLSISDWNTVREIQSGKKLLYLYGWVKYGDIFSSETHTSLFCYRIILDAAPIVPGTPMPEPAWSPCQAHNSAE